MSDNIFLAIIGSAVVTAIIRAGPVLFLAHRRFPILFRNWLVFVPPAILSAIIASEVMHHTKTIPYAISINTVYGSVASFGIYVSLLATIATFFVALWSKSLFASVVASVIFYLLFQHV